MKQVLLTPSGVAVEEVPAPTTQPGRLLVATVASCISAGTEMAGVEQAHTPLWRRALQEPEKVRRAFDLARQHGLRHARDVAIGKLESGHPTGYSAAGVVLDVGAGVAGYAIGDRVACAGAGVANHSEIISVPENLTVPVPNDVSWHAAATVTLGSIAMQGVRRASPTLGETIAVIGLGLLGQLTVQLLRANGCRVLAMDLDEHRVQLARDHGAHVAMTSTSSVLDDVRRLTDGVGVDAVIVTAATPSDEVMSQAFQLCRKKGRVVLVGDVGLDIRRHDIYAKELDFFISTSYGPGRYDRRYEEEGLDYPIGYVRWTENRNMSEYLRLVDAGQVRLEGLIHGSYRIDDAPQAYAALANDSPRPLIVLLDYPDTKTERKPRVTVVNSRPTHRQGDLRFGVIGAGSFARSVHLPNLRALPGAELRAVSTRTGSDAMAVARQFGGEYATTDPEEILEDVDVDAVIIATRHDTHASLAARALRAGKHVLLEKPLAIDAAGLATVSHVVDELGDASPVLMTAYNRRFSPTVVALQTELEGRAHPIIINYQMNADWLPADHWVHGPTGGGRNVGEACHVYDLFLALTGAAPVGVTATAARPRSYYQSGDNFVATLNLSDGSVASLTYTAMGSSAHPKETMSVFAEGEVYLLDDYRTLRRAPDVELASARTVDKGHAAELRRFGEAVRSGVWPISWADQHASCRVSLDVQALLHAGGS